MAACGAFARRMSVPISRFTLGVGSGLGLLPTGRAMIAPESYRQSILQSFERCGRRTWHSLQMPDDLALGWVESTGALGTVVHDVIAELLRTLRAQGEPQMATEEAMVIMREVYVASGVVLPAKERDELRGMILSFAGYRFNSKRIMAIEGPLKAQIKCPDGKLRTLTGRPDLLVADPPEGIVIDDWKSGQGKPKTPRGAVGGEPIVGKQYLSDRGHFQLDCYGYLAMMRYPAAEYAILRELHLRSGEVREATLGRAELEHVEYELGAQMQKLEMAIEEGEDAEAFKPTPGRQCLKQCPAARTCPIPEEQRGVGAIEDEVAADAQAERFVVVDGLRQQLRAQLKAWFEDTGRPAEVGDGTGLYWRKDAKGKRSFGVFPLDREIITDEEAVI